MSGLYVNVLLAGEQPLMFTAFSTSYYSLGQKICSTSLKISFACPEYTVNV